MSRPRWLGPALLLALTITLTLAPGRGSATIAEQRARLPPPAACKDPVSGVWQSHSFNEMYQEWGRFTLTVRRVPDSDTQLEGEIINESWYGPKTENVRGPCVGRIQYIVSMPGEGSYEGAGKAVDFRGTSWKMENPLCGVDDGFGYNLDHFSGVIDHEIQEFQTVNNDGGRYVDVPTVFRRISCDDAPDIEPRITMVPPPLYPPQEKSGCGVSD
jgi:hypothetical protein